MKEKFKAFGAWILKIIMSAIQSVLKGFVEKPIKTIITTLISIFGIVTVSNPTGVFNTFRTITTDSEMHRKIEILHEENRKISEQLSLANATNLYNSKMFESELKAVKKELGKEIARSIDSIEGLNKKIVALSQGSGTMTITGGGDVDSGSFSDPWIDAYVEIDSMKKVNLNYQLRIRVKDISLSYYDADNGSRNEIYSVMVQSLKDSSMTYYLGDYVRTIKYQAKEPERPPERVHTSINGDIVYAGYGVEAGASISLLTFGNWKFPDIGISSDFENSHNVSAGIRYNVGSFLPLFQDLWISLKYGYNFGQQGSNALIGIGTTL